MATGQCQPNQLKAAHQNINTNVSYISKVITIQIWVFFQGCWTLLTCDEPRDEASSIRTPQLSATSAFCVTVCHVMGGCYSPSSQSADGGLINPADRRTDGLLTVHSTASANRKHINTLLRWERDLHLNSLLTFVTVCVCEPTATKTLFIQVLQQ